MRSANRKAEINARGAALFVVGRGGVASVSQMVQSLTRTRPWVSGGELLVGLVVKIFGDVSRLKGVEGGEGVKVKEHLVVDSVDDWAQDLLEQFEVEWRRPPCHQARNRRG